MGIIRTNQWLKEDFDHLGIICEKLIPYFNDEDTDAIYRQLVRFGMYKPSRTTWNTYKSMESDKVWNKVQALYQNYRKKWSGPEIPIFVFPIDQVNSFWRKTVKNKSGVSYPDKMFLFLSQLEDKKELEALFIHEYHHVCRLNKLNKYLQDYSLLDSMIIEGLAEYAVYKHCGKKYLADWCNLYSEKQIGYFWNQYLKDHLNSKKTDRIHDALLYGQGRIPRLLGYAAGFSVVQEYYQKHDYAIRQTFSIPAEQLIENDP